MGVIFRELTNEILLFRDSPAGKALFNLYKGDGNGRIAGQQFHDRNRKVHEQKVASGWIPDPIEPQRPFIEKPKVNYPKFGQAKSTEPAPVQHIPHRKPGHVIQEELHGEKERLRHTRQPPRKGALLDQQEKERCAQLMQYRGKPPVVPAEESTALRKQRKARNGPKSEREELQEMFDNVMLEIQEREEFIKDMEAHGALKQDHVHQLRAEIKARVTDLARLDKLLHELDA